MKWLLLCFVVCIAYVGCKGGGLGLGTLDIFKGSYERGKESRSHTYPASTGYSGHGSGGPVSNGISGLGNQRDLKYGQRYGSYSNCVPRLPSYYTAPQYVYVSQYRSSNSRFNNLLIGLTMYNMGRSHSHVYRNHYYQDSYYRRSSSSTASSIDHGSSSASSDQTNNKDEATCFMRIEEDEKEEVLKIPCAIVTTFADGKRKVTDTSEQTSTECNMSNDKSAELKSTMDDSAVAGSKTVDKDSSENHIICKSTPQSIDPLAVTGPPLNTLSMKCTIEIWTSKEVISNDVECKTLLRYATIPVPENKNAFIIPPRSELKEMLQRPPWWLSLFLAV